MYVCQQRKDKIFLVFFEYPVITYEVIKPPGTAVCSILYGSAHSSTRQQPKMRQGFISFHDPEISVLFG
jgi:hypothetical protein